MAREKLTRNVSGGGAYFSSPNPHIAFISSGCKLLDLALGGGWAENRIFNIVGDKSTGKTLLCIEAAANFVMKYDQGEVKYREAEQAFDEKYAEALGMPMQNVDFGDTPLDTVEDLFDDLNDVIKRKRKGPVLYLCDSLDALSDRAEMDRDMDKGSYGAEKAKKLSQMFRRLVRDMGRTNITLGIVSQVRDKIGAMFGRKTTRSGGRALDFYASQVLYLAHIGIVKKNVSGIRRATGVRIKAHVDKNKVSLAYREAEFNIKFGYGVDDALACLEWLNEGGWLKYTDIKKEEIKERARNMHGDEFADIAKLVEKRWYELEKQFIPNRKKYNVDDSA